MNILKLKTWSERQQVLAIILMAGVLIFLAWFFALSPLTRQRRRLEREIEGMANQLAAKNYLRGEEALLREKESELTDNRRLHARWLEMSERLAAFRNQKRLAGGRYRSIDFKVALFDVRQRLMAKSRALNISLPDNIGMDERVDSNEDARRLMLQLRTVEKLVDLTLDLKINTLRNIQPLPPVQHKAKVRDTPYLEEYAVRLDFYGSLENLFALFRAVLEPEHVFMLKNLRVEAADPHQNIFNISTVMSALLFLCDPDEIIPAPKKQKGRSRPRGY